MRLLPNRTEIGWTPYAWLIYLTPIFFAPLPNPAPWEFPLAIAVTGVFLVLYFRFFWVAGRRQLVIAWTTVLLALLYTPINPGASTMFVFAGSFFGIALRRADAVKAILLVVLAVAIEAWLVPLPPASWIPAIVFTPLIGMINAHFRENSRANARLQLAQEEVERLAKLDERERIARDLHDLLGHTLSVVTLKSELAGRLLGTSEGGNTGGVDRETIQRVQTEVRDIQDITRKAMSEVRSSISGFRTHSLQSELARAKMALAAAQIHCDVRPSPYALDPDREPVAALALREAVTNVVRHSNALACTITLRTVGAGSTGAPGRFELIVEDDGRGLRGASGSDGDRKGGTGLDGMRERVEGVGGTVQLTDCSHRPLGGGCRLAVSLPLAEPSAREDCRDDSTEPVPRRLGASP